MKGTRTWFGASLKQGIAMSSLVQITNLRLPVNTARHRNARARIKYSASRFDSVCVALPWPRRALVLWVLEALLSNRQLRHGGIQTNGAANPLLSARVAPPHLKYKNKRRMHADTFAPHATVQHPRRVS